MIKNFELIKRIVLIVMIVALIASLIPILYIARFNHPYRDDYTNAILTHDAYMETGTLGAVLSAAVERTVEVYEGWQGTFSSVFLFALNPCIWVDSLYIIVTYIMIFAFTFSTMFFAYQLFVWLLKLDKTSSIIVAIMVVILSIQFIPSPVESFFWYVGSVHYLLFYSFSLVLFGLVIRYLASEGTKLWVYLLLSLPLAFFIGGGNYVTVLNVAIVLSLALTYLLLKKNKKWVYVLLVLIVVLVAFSISAIAPGNAGRATHFEKIYTVTGTMRESLEQGLKFSFTLFDAPKGTVAIILLALMATLPLLKKLFTNEKMTFKYPLLVVLLLFGLLSAQFTPSLYAMGSRGPYRLINIVFLSYVWYLLFTIIYLAGWIYRKVTSLATKESEVVVGNAIAKMVVPYLMVVVILCSALLYVLMDTKKNQRPTSYVAATSILSYEAYAYHVEYLERLEILESDELSVVIEPFSVKPQLLLISDYIDIGFSSYYHKESIVFEQEEEPTKE